MSKPQSVDEYIASIPSAARKNFDALRKIVKEEAVGTNEVVSYGIIGYKIDDKRARVYISGWKDRTSVYPIPDDEVLCSELKPYTRGKGTLSFSNSASLPEDLIRRTVAALLSD